MAASVWADLRKQVLPCMAWKGGDTALFEQVASLLTNDGGRKLFRVVVCGMGSPVVKRHGRSKTAEGTVIAADSLHASFKRPAVLVLFLTPEVFAQKDLAKAFEFLAGKDKDDVAPELLLVSVTGPRKGGEENVAPNMEALQLLSGHVKRLYKIDIRDSVVVWDLNKPQQSAEVLKAACLQSSSVFYGRVVAQQVKSIKTLRKSQRTADVFVCVQSLFLAGLYSEFQRLPSEALSCYREAFDQLKLVPTTSSRDQDEMSKMTECMSMLSLKIWTQQLALHHYADLKKHFEDLVALFRKVHVLPVSQALYEWISQQHVLLAELLVVPNADLQLNAFYHYSQAALSLRSAREARHRTARGSQATPSSDPFEQRIADLLTRAYSEARNVPVSTKRSKLRIAVMLAEEASRAGRHSEALELCQRISNPRNDEAVSRYKQESWWSLLGVVDDIAAVSARKLGQHSVAIKHALRCLSPAARASPACKTRMMEMVFELRKSLEEPIEWFMFEEVASESLIAMSVKFDNDVVPLGSLVKGSVILESHLPMVTAFDDMTLTFSASANLKMDQTMFPLLLKPFEKRVVQFASPSAFLTPNAASDDVILVETVALVLGQVSFVRVFENCARPPKISIVDSEMSPVAAPKILVGAKLVENDAQRVVPKIVASRSSGAVNTGNRRLTVERATGVVDCYGLHMNASEVCPALDTLRGGLAVRGLELGSNNFGNEGVGLVSNWILGGAAPQLGSLSLWNCGLGPQCGSHVATILRSCPGLRVLNLGLNRIGDGGIAAFARCLQISPALEELVLWRVSLTKAGFIVLSDNLLPPSRLRVLDLRSNELGEGSDVVVSSFLSANFSLQQLYIADNPGLTSASTLKDLASSISQSNFSIQSFGEDIESRSLNDLAKRNKDVMEMLRGGSLALPFRGLTSVPSILLQPTGFGKRMTHLDLSHNQIRTLPPELVSMECLSHLIVSHNLLSDLPADLSKLRSLAFLDFSHNTISLIPAELGLLSRLTHLIASDNALQSVVPELFNAAAPVCQTLRELDLSFNHLASIPGTFSNLRVLQSLRLNNNQLTELSASLAKLLAGGLASCNLSHNRLHSLPPPLFEYRKSINISFNPFVEFPPEIVARGPVAVWDYLEDLLHGQQLCPRMKLMFVGQGNVGKTTLLQALTGRVDAKNKVVGFVTGKGIRKQTDGIEVSDWMPEDDLTFSTWDFAGQEVYYNTHQFFLSQRSLYLVVFSLAVPLQEGNILTWLNSLQVRAPGVTIMLIGTHADKKFLQASHLTDVSEKLRTAIAKWSKLYRKEGRVNIIKPTVAGSDLWFYPVSSIRKTANGLAELRAAIIKAARAQPCVKEHVPKLYLSLLEVVKRKRVELADQPFVDWATVKSWGVIPDESALRRACRLLHDWGDIVSFQDGTSALSDLVILDPNWLTMFMTTIVGVSVTAGTISSAPSHGVSLPTLSSALSMASNPAIISPASLPVLWKAYPTNLYQPMCKLLEKFQVWVKLGNGDFLVPCLLQSQPSKNLFDSTARNTEHTIGRDYVIPFCPHGFFSHLLLRMWSFCNVAEYWSSGCVLRDVRAGEQVLALVEVVANATEQNPFQSLVQILVKCDSKAVGAVKAAAFMTKLVFTFHSFVQDWYGGLSDHIATLLPCVECLKRRSQSSGPPHMFAADAFIRDYVGTGGNESVECPVCGCKVAICDIVPEMVELAEGQGHYVHEVTEIKSIGLGGFAEVMLAKWKGQEVAVKKLFLNSASMGSEGFTLQTFEDFAMEVHMIRKLDHPNVVKLFAAYSRPPAIVLEFVPMGSLDSVLKSMTGPVDYQLMLRMAADVARGLEYLHGFNPRILHRDLKSPNILVQSLDLTAPVLLKVADLGLSCFYMGATSGKMIENPRWVSPETLETGLYTDKSDVYSFGIICNELATRKLPFDDISFNSEVERAIKLGRQVICLLRCFVLTQSSRPAMAVGAPEKFNKIVAECWSRDPSARPTFKDLCVRIQLVIETCKSTI